MTTTMTNLPNFVTKMHTLEILSSIEKVLEDTVAQSYYWRQFLAREHGIQKWRHMVREKDIWGRPREDNPWD